jgi:outer membrane autotransporter protein
MKSETLKNSRRLFAAAALAFAAGGAVSEPTGGAVFSPALRAASHVWNGGADGVWNYTAYNWRDAATGSFVTVFREDDHATFATPGATVRAGDAMFAGTITVNAPATLGYVEGVEALVVARNLFVADGVTLRNNGLLGVEETASGAVANTGVFAASVLRGSLENAPGAVALIEAHSGGVIANRGALALEGRASWETLDNSGGVVDFGGVANALTVRDLRAAGGAGGYIAAVDLAFPENSNRLTVTGQLSGSHRFTLTDATSSPVALTPESGRGLLLIETPNDADRSDEDVRGTLESGVYSYSLTPAAGGAGYELGNATYTAAGHALVNTAGAVALGWFAQTDSLSKRFGDLRLAKAETVSVWVRGHAQRTDSDFKIEGICEFAEYQYGADAGFDLRFEPAGGLTLYLGGFASCLSAHRVFRDALGSRGDTDAWGVGGHALLMHKSGLYGAVTGRFQRFENGFDTSGDTADWLNHAAGAGVEAGWHIALDGGFFVEPSVQGDYAHVFSETYSTARRLRVLCGDSDIIRVAGAVRAGKSESLGGWGVFQRYVRAGIYQQESYGGSVRVGGFRQRPRSDGLYAVGGAGVAWQITPRVRLHAEYETAFGEKLERPWSVNAAVRVSF